MANVNDKDTLSGEEGVLRMAESLAKAARSRELNYAAFYFETQKEHFKKSQALAESRSSLLRSSFVYAML